MINCNKPNVHIEGSGEEIINDFGNIVCAVYSIFAEELGKELCEEFMDQTYAEAKKRSAKKVKEPEGIKLDVEKTLAAIAALIQHEDENEDENEEEDEDGRSE